VSPRVSKPKGEPKSVVKRKPRTVAPANNGKHPGGRPSKYTPEMVKALCEGLSTGNMRRAVCAFNGINTDTLYDWMKTKEEFSDAVRKAEAEAEYRNVIKISLGRQGWQAAAWWLERKYHEDWGRRDRVDMAFDSRKMAESQLQAAGLPSDPESVDRIVAYAEAIATQRE
jgi:transposase